MKRTTLASTFAALLSLPLAAQQSKAPDHTCTINLTNPGHMKDIVSNALVLGLQVRESDVRKFLRGAEDAYPDGKSLLRAAAKAFSLPVAKLQQSVEQFKHCNCKAGEAPAAPAGAPAAAKNEKLTDFAKNVTIHVALHELGHALIREFDLPILGNEETMADAFATHFLANHLPKRAAAVLEARVRSLMVEAKEVPRGEWPVRGEHNNDARRAFQIAAMAVAADRTKFANVADAVGMSDRDRRKSADYGAEVHRSWRRILQPLLMPANMASNEARVRCEDAPGLLAAIKASKLPEELGAVLRRFDWHSQVTLRFARDGGGASWSRSKRTITISAEYVRRFVRQGAALEKAGK